MNEPLNLEVVYGIKCLRPALYQFGWTDPRELYDATGITSTLLGVPARPRCDYCGMFTHPEGYKCKSCGAPK